MRFVALLLVLGGVAAAGPLGFDHAIHDGKVVAAGGASPDCASCHAQPPGHKSCFASACHTMPRKGRVAMCQACHAEDQPRKAFYPPYTVDPDFSTPFAHDQHAGRTKCQTCHGGGPESTTPRPEPHVACATCHQAEMATCTRCHVAVAGRDLTPRSAQTPYLLHFAHASHFKTGADCASCHENVVTTPGEEVPKPAMTACETCHDGKQAFAALAPTCTRCHEANPEVLPSDAPVQPFSHGRHVERGLRLPCASCHASADAVPARDHFPCADEACHASEFRAPRPTICGACHVGTEPGRKLRADRERRTRSEFGVELSHATHAADCASCHVGLAGGPEMRLGKGHASCASCHAKTMDACEGCHVPGLLAARDDRRRTSTWSVAKAFSHANHPAPCGSCHTTAAAATTIAAIAPPAKPTCAPCHDGTKSFKMTGHGCARCHAK